MDNYLIVKYLKTEKFYTLYQGIHKKFNEKVQIKVLSEHIANSLNFDLRLDLWIDKLLSLKHKNIVSFLDIFRDKDSWVFVSEWVEGVPLSEYVKQKSLSLLEIKNLFIQILEAYHYAHQQDVIYGGVDIDKIWILPGKIVKIDDFGLRNVVFKALSAQEKLDYSENIEFCSPEQVESQSIGHLSDIYSLGILLYFLAEGKLPFDSQDPEKISEQILSQKLPLIKTYPQLNKFFVKATSKDPSKRYQMIAIWLDEFKDLQVDVINLTTDVPEEEIAKQIFENKTIDSDVQKEKNNLEQKSTAQNPTQNENLSTQIPTNQTKRKKIRLFWKFLLLILQLGITIWILSWLINGIKLFSSYSMGTKIQFRYTKLKGARIWLNNDSIISGFLIEDEYLANFKYNLSQDSILTSYALPFKAYNLWDLEFYDSIYFFVGGKILNDYVYPALILIFPMHYEPYFQDEEGVYTNICIKDNKLILSKLELIDTSTKNLWIEIRNWDFDLSKRLLVDIGSNITPIDLKTIENLVLIAYKKNSNLTLKAIDYYGDTLWTYKFKFTSNLRPNNLIKIKNDSVILVITTPKNLKIKLLNLYNGKQIKENILPLKKRQLIDFQINNSQIWLLLSKNNNTQIIAYSFKNEKINYKKNFYLVQGHDFKIKNNKLTIIGTILSFYTKAPLVYISSIPIKQLN